MTKNKIDDGGISAPNAKTSVLATPPTTGLMTLRDYFAGQALAGLAASPMTSERFEARLGISPEASWRILAETSYALADVMLSARSSGGDADE